MKYVANDRTRNLRTNIFLKIRFLRSHNVSDERLKEAKYIHSNVIEELKKEETDHKSVQEDLKDCRSILNRILQKHFGTASLNKLCDWKD